MTVRVAVPIRTAPNLSAKQATNADHPRTTRERHL